MTDYKKGFLGGVFAAVLVWLLSGSDSGKAVVKKITDRYRLTKPLIKRRTRNFFVFERLVAAVVIYKFIHGDIVAACWGLLVMGLPLMMMMFIIKWLFPRNKRVVRGIAIPCLMLHDVPVLAVLFFSSIAFSGSVWLLFFLYIVKSLMDLGMITGSDSNRPYKLALASCLAAGLLFTVLVTTGFKTRIESWHMQLYLHNMKQAATYVTIREETIPYELYDNELEDIVLGRKIRIERVMRYVSTGKMIPGTTKAKLCGWAKVINSFTGTPNIVIALKNSKGDYNPESPYLADLKKQFFIIPLENTEWTSSSPPAPKKKKVKKNTDPETKIKKKQVIATVGLGGHINLPEAGGTGRYYMEVPPGTYVHVTSPRTGGGQHADNRGGSGVMKKLWTPEELTHVVDDLRPTDAVVKIIKI